MLIDKAMEKQWTFHSREPHELDICIRKDDFGKPKLSEKNQILLIHHLHTCLKHTKQYCLTYGFKHMWGKSIKTERAIQVQEDGFLEEGGGK